MTTDLIPAFEAHLRNRNRTRRTIETYTRTLAAMDRELPYGLDTANETEIQAWIWRDGLKPASRAIYLAAVRGFFRWCVVHAEVMDFDPTQRLHPPKIPRRVPHVATDEHVRQVMTQSQGQYLLWAAIGAYAGLRCIEIYRLQREHVTAHTLRVVQGKGGVARAVPTHPHVWELVEPKPAGPVTDVADERVLSRRFRVHCERIDLPNLGMHQLRGWWATNTYRITKDLRAVQQGMGHANPGTTAGYIDPGDTSLRASVDGLPRFRAPGI